MANLYKKLTQDVFDRSSTKKRIIRFVIIAVLSLWAMAVLFLIDTDNMLRPEFLGGRNFGASVATYPSWNGGQSTYIPNFSRNFVSDFVYNVMNMAPHNVGILDWAFLGTILLGAWAWAIYDCFDKKIRAKFDIDNTEREDYKKRLNIYKILVASCIVLLCIIFLVVVLVVLATTNSDKTFSALGFLLSMAYALLLMLIIPATVFLFLLVYSLIYYIYRFFKFIFGLGKKKKDNAENGEEEDKSKSGAGSGNGDLNLGREEYDTSLGKVFPSLKRIDEKYADEANIPTFENTGVTLKELVLRFRSYLCQRKLYFDEKTLRNFIGGLSVSRLLVLEGLSGTGKSTLPRLFSDFVGNKVFYSPVQATWRDRTDLVGYYSEFTKEYKETDFLKRLYEASFKNQEINMMVLDEMNISRIEYYFADFLSVLEYPSDDWKIHVMQMKDGQEQPAKFVDGNVMIPTNTWFIGTANTDDSTFTISDKVYDRAIVLDFLRINDPFEMDYNSEEIHMSSEELLKLFKEAQETSEYRLNDEERAKFRELCDFVLDTFNITFGNRIMNQIENFVPVYVALGGTKVEALDFIFSRKVMRKLQGKYDEYVKDGLTKMVRYINTLYGKDALPYTEESIVELRKKLI
ncbi:MAG: hypothetical protein J6C97_05080 [Clostridia bacterium]|nr:hypothetical protein [Clostridia bacterium]